VKVKTKLAFITAIFVTLPVIFILALALNFCRNTSAETKLTDIQKIIKCQSDNVSVYFDEVISRSKEISSVDDIKKYTTIRNDENIDYEDYDELSSSVDSLINLAKKSSNSIEAVYILNNSGVVISSTNKGNINRYMPDCEQIFEYALINKGISPFFILHSESFDTVSFSISKNIYSSDNKKQGVLYIVYNTSTIQDILSNTKTEKYSTMAVMDREGNVLTYSYNSITNYKKHGELSIISDKISDILNTTNDVPLIKQYEYKFGGKEKIFDYSKSINSEMVVIGMTLKESIYDEIDKNMSGIKALAFLLIIVVIILVVFVIYQVLKPFDTIIRVINKKQNGDINAKMDLDSNDEFGAIAHAFNTMFNDVFENEQRYRTIVEMTNNIVFEINYKKDTVFVSKNFNKKFGFRPKDDSLAESFFYKGRIHKDDKEKFTHDFERLLETSNFLQGEYRFKNIYGDFSWVMIKANKFYDRDDIPTKIVGVIVDIDREKKSEMHLLQKASYDNLTQLYNREAFTKALAAEMEQSAIKKTLEAMLFIDLDDFKHFNDQYGHACGDEVLKFVADTLKEVSFERGFAGRLGGDEFVVCITNLTLIGDIGDIAQEIIDILGKGFYSENCNQTLAINCSIGIAFFRENGKTPQELMSAADEAMYVVKKHGKSAYSYAKSVTATQK
jgi:diguanylate cyclase (GGDEF)-like protein/PAS domain S-box-containing protein